MSDRSEPGRDTYDAVVIGSGLGGLVAAAVLARADQSVLLVERQDGLGGYMHAFQRGPYIFDPAIHVTSQGGDGQLLDVILSYLGVRELVTLLPVDPYYETFFPGGFRLVAPIGIERHIEAHVAAFPHEQEGITKFYRLCEQMQYEVHRLSMSLSLSKLDEMVAKYPTFFRYRLATLKDVADEFIGDERAKNVVTTAWAYQGLAPSKAGFLGYAQTLMNLMESNWFSQGSFQRLADAFGAAVENHGGDVVVGDGARKILVEDGKAVGVVLDSGRQVHAPVVVSNAAALHTFEELVGIEHLPAPFVKRMRRLTFALPAFVIFAAGKYAFGDRHVAHETFVNQTWDQERNYQDVLEGKPGGVWVNVPTALDPTVAPPDEHLFIISSVAVWDPGRPWSEHREEFSERLLDLAETAFPDLRESLSFSETATPVTLQRYTGNTQGAMYGWENTAQQQATKRLDHKTPVEGLYLSGHWTMPGSGSTRCIASGIHTAMIVLKDRGAQVELPSFADADLPSLG